MMSEVRVIARREFVERVRSKWFVIGTLLGPVFMLAVVLVPALLADQGGEQARVQLVDRSGELAEPLTRAFAQVGWQVTAVPPAPQAELLDRIRREVINGFLEVPPDVLTGGEVVYQGDNATAQAAVLKLHTVVTAVVMARRGAAAGLTEAQLGRVLSPVRISARHTTGEAEGTSGTAAFVLGYAVMFVLYMGILLYAVAVMRSVVEEKTSRVVELMVAATRPRALMAGKILGVGAVGLVQLAVWLGMGLVTLRYRAALLGAFGAGGGGVALPPLEAGQVAVALAYFLLGYFFYAALYAAVGAMVSSEQEAQQAQTPVMMLLIIPVMCTQLVANAPRGAAAQVMTLLPVSSPVLMPMRYLLGGATTLELLGSLAILAASTLLVVRGAAKIYRVGILMYGKRPSVAELWRWLRH